MNHTHAAPRGGLLARLGLDRRELRAWAMYDWANSAFATTVMAAVLPIYFVKVAAADFAPNVATALWGYTSSVGLVLIVVLSPVLGAISDFLGAKKPFLGACMAVGALATAALWLVGRGDWLLAGILFTIGNLAFSASIVFYDALLPYIAAPDEMDRVSSGGWAVGYVGGGLLLLINAVMITKPALFGMADASEASRWAFVTVAAWWAIFSIPVLRVVREPTRELEPDESPALGAVRAGFARLGETLREIRRYPDLLKFLLAFWLYSDGLGTIIEMATAYGSELGIGTSALIGALLVTQFVGVPFTFLFGAIAERIGAKRGIYITLVVYSLISIAGYFVENAWQFWALAIAVGTVQGGAQALGRSLYASLIPRSKSSEFFGFFSVFEKFSGVAGPIVFGVVSQLTGTSRFGILAIIVFFLLGLFVLTRVDLDAGRRAALAEDATLHPAPAAAT